MYQKSQMAMLEINTRQQEWHIILIGSRLIIRLKTSEETICELE